MKRCFAALALLLFSCTARTVIPKDVLPVPDMTNVLWDVMLTDALANHWYPIDSAKRFDTSVVLYQQVVKAHGTSQAQFKKSLRFYETRPDLFQTILDSLQKRADRRVPTVRPADTATRKNILLPHAGLPRKAP